jgi:hypothetical protein
MAGVTWAVWPGWEVLVSGGPPVTQDVSYGRACHRPRGISSGWLPDGR